MLAVRDLRASVAGTQILNGVLVITRYKRLLEEVRPDVVHVLAKGRIVTSGGPESVDELEDSGYATYAEA